MLGRIIRAEALHSRLRNSNAHSTNRTSASIDTIQILQPDGTVKSTSSAAEMVPLIIDHNRVSLQPGRRHTVHRWFAAISRTYCVLPSSREHLGRNFVDRRHFRAACILHSSSCYSQVSSQTPYVDCALSIDDVKAGYAAWREATSTSPYGDHLGIYKVLLKDST